MKHQRKPDTDGGFARYNKLSARYRRNDELASGDHTRSASQVSRKSKSDGCDGGRMKMDSRDDKHREDGRDDRSGNDVEIRKDWRIRLAETSSYHYDDA